MRIESINIGAAERIDMGDRSMETGIFKNPVPGPVRLTRDGFAGDAIVNTRHHGGVDQAVYAYSLDDYDWWAEHMDREFFPGLFGENLTIRGLPTDMHVGDRLLIGEVVLEATAPRIPCSTFATRMEDPGFGLTFRKAERPGIYFRVLNEGEVCVGDAVTPVETTEHSVTILDLFRYKYRSGHEPGELRRLLEAPLAERMHADIEQRLASIHAS
jgi:MOSC domain-containing protein YiiM